MSVAAWDEYAGTLAVWGAWDPTTTAGRDLLLEARELPTTANVARQAIAQLKVTYATLPPEVRGQVMDALRLVQERISDGMEALELVGDLPIVGWVVAGIQARGRPGFYFHGNAVAARQPGQMQKTNAPRGRR